MERPRLVRGGQAARIRNARPDPSPKERVPLWKKELYEGGEEWIGRGS
jgi:hypothetical protein